jgi:hypothetical protein
MASVSPVKLDSLVVISIDETRMQSAGIALPFSITTRSPTTKSSESTVVVTPCLTTMAVVLSDLACSS